ncbi:MAG: chemotaxis protein CheR, partial [Lawsonibacter sp.]|nr:chemotaxis protein CheR [Lawsonibacter sp.]
MIQTISDEDFRKLTNFIKSQYGITLEAKRQLVTSRLSSLLAEQGCNDFSQFVTQLLKERDPQKIEQVLNRLTTNYTFFMRETEHFDFFTKVILPELVRKHQRNKVLAIWSAGCSSGEEPYNLSMYIKDYLG